MQAHIAATKEVAEAVVSATPIGSVLSRWMTEFETEAAKTEEWRAQQQPAAAPEAQLLIPASTGEIHIRQTMW